MSEKHVTWYRWDDMEKERVSDILDRRLITGERIMLTHVYLKKGGIVPRHSHENEQITYVLSGSMRFWIGADEAQELFVRAGEVLHIPANVPHKAEALEDTIDVDIFSPPRQDWLDKTDDYLRQTSRTSLLLEPRRHSQVHKQKGVDVGRLFDSLFRATGPMTGLGVDTNQDGSISPLGRLQRCCVLE
jgi:unsaturated pyranuronate lyase